MGKQKTHEQFCDDLYLKNIEVEPLEPYINSHTPISCRCKKCGLIWKVRPNNLLTGYGCPSCAGKYRRTPEDFITDLHTINPYIEVIGEYINTHTKVDCRCLICNHMWSAQPSKLLSGKGCPHCARKKRGDALRKAHQQFVAEMHQVNNNIDILGEYISQKIKVLCFCKICGYKWSTLPSNLLKGQGCPECARKKRGDALRKSHQQFVAEIKSVSPKIEIRRKQGCPACNTSKKAVINLTTGKIYESASEAGRQLGVGVNAVGMVCRGEAKTCKGDRWCYVVNLTNEEKKRYGLATP